MLLIPAGTWSSVCKTDVVMLRRIIVTPAGRKKYLEILAVHLERQKHDFDEWWLWVNTAVEDDIRFCERLAAAHPTWIGLRFLPPGVQVDGNQTIFAFFAECTRADTAYLRLDDDVVWLQPDFVRRMFLFRERNVVPFLVYGNILNNAITSFLHCRTGHMGHVGNVDADTSSGIREQRKDESSASAAGIPGYSAVDPVGWTDPAFAVSLHDSFLDDLETLGDTQGSRRWHFAFTWELSGYERCSINAISWLGSRFGEFGGRVGVDEEAWLSCMKPRRDGTPCVVQGDAVCVHFAFGRQRESMGRATEDRLLARYRRRAGMV